MVAAAVGIGTAVAGIAGSAMSSNAASKAAGAQSASAQAGINAQQNEFNQVRAMLAPYAQAGTGALGAQQNLIGVNGAPAQQQAISNLQSQPYYQSQLAAGQNAILQNASATGGLRGGNTQGLLAGFAPGLLAQTIQQQYSNLGGLTSIGQNAAAMTGNAGMSTTNNITGLLGQQGAASAGADLAAGRADANMGSSVLSGFGAYQGYNTNQLLNQYLTQGGGGIPAVGAGGNSNGYNGTLNNPSAFVAGGPF